MEATLAEIARNTEQCVKCGLCLPACPTYQLSGSEAESPRGRLALMQGAAVGALEGSPRFWQHLDSCLDCRACETACPSKVPYSRTLELSRRILLRPADEQKTPVGRLGNLAIRRLLPYPDRIRRIGQLLRFYQRSGLQRLAQTMGFFGIQSLRRLDAELPRLSTPFRAGAKPVSHSPNSNPAVALFTGCAATEFDSDTLRASEMLLTRFGFNVTLPPQQRCCGALPRHSGNHTLARDLLRQNLQAFADDPLIVTSATGCAAQLLDYRHEPGGDGFSDRVRDIQTLLLESWPEGLVPQRLDRTIGLHLPCSQRNVLHTPDASTQLLRRIPGLSLIPVGDNRFCCGAAGSYHLSHRSTADELVNAKLDNLSETGITMIVSANYGCGLHLLRAAKERGLDLQVLHPVTLLARQLPAPTDLNYR
ncbi:MAG: (Fe-S)-binding protein [Gammaproteobacteria bacterium]|nr:(Fe-S)-binding protein [Gammaproteobacteria bacterium]